MQRYMADQTLIELFFSQYANEFFHYYNLPQRSHKSNDQKLYYFECYKDCEAYSNEVIYLAVINLVCILGT